MSDNDPSRQPAPLVPDPSLTQPPAAPAGGQSLAPGAGSPLVPGPPMSVNEPLPDTTLNFGGLVMLGGLVVAAIIVIVVLIAIFHH